MSKHVAVASGVLGILIMICGVAVTICGVVWMADFHDVIFPKTSHFHGSHGVWSGPVFIFGGAVGTGALKHPTRQTVPELTIKGVEGLHLVSDKELFIGTLMVLLLMSWAVTLAGWIEVALLGDFFTHLWGQALDTFCTRNYYDDQALADVGPKACKIMAVLRAVAAFSGIGGCLGIGGIITASIGLSAERNTGLINEEELPQPQGPVVMTQPGQFIAVQHTHVAQQYHPGSHVVTQNPPGQVSGHHFAVTVPVDQNAPPAYTK